MQTQVATDCKVVAISQPKAQIMEQAIQDILGCGKGWQLASTNVVGDGFARTAYLFFTR